MRMGDLYKLYAAIYRLCMYAIEVDWKYGDRDGGLSVRHSARAKQRLVPWHRAPSSTMRPPRRIRAGAPRHKCAFFRTISS
jgi:hypothetical protein